MLLVGLATAALIVGISQWATAPTWVPAFANVPVESTKKITEQLTGANIEYRLNGGGTEIQVKSEELAAARVAVAADGGLPSTGRPGLELFDQPSWGMTDFTQRINYRRALEGELERTIAKMRGIELAQVHIAMQEGNVFRAPDKPLEASVVLKLQNGDTPPADVVQGIAHLVASSIDGLQSEHVTIVDDAGRMLTLDSESGSLAGLTSQQLAMQREVETHLEKKASTILGQVVGAKNARVQVSALMNFDRLERTTQAVDPEKQAIATEQKAEVTPGAQGGQASSNTAMTYETTKSTESFSGAIGNVRRLTVSVLVNDKALAGAKPTTAPRDAAELARIDTLVRNAIGVDSARGDKLSVVNMTFDATPGIVAEQATPDLWTRVGQVQRPLVTGLALLAVLVVAVLTLRALKPGAAPALHDAGAMAALPSGAPPNGRIGSAVDSATGSALVGAAAPAGALGSGMPETFAPTAESRAQPTSDAERQQVRITSAPMSPMVLQESTNPVRDQVVAIIDQRPEAATRIVREWLKQD